MQFRMKLVYQDNKDLDISIDEASLPNFFESLNKHKIYWNHDSSHGFWTDLEKVRYVQFMATPEPQEKNGKEEDKESIRELSIQDGQSSPCTDSACAG